MPPPQYQYILKEGMQASKQTTAVLKRELRAGPSGK
jgi:hypothetical protein